MSSSSSPSNNDGSYYYHDKIPILKRRAAAAASQQSSSSDHHSNTNDNPNNNPSSSCSSRSSSNENNEPVVIIIVGMAGSGKTTLMAQLLNNDNSLNNHHDNTTTTSNEEAVAADAANAASSHCCYPINLDPATKYLPYSPAIDIRDTIDYVQVMKQHQLGPNGAILTCLNLFATKFDQVMTILERRCGLDSGGHHPPLDNNTATNDDENTNEDKLPSSSSSTKETNQAAAAAAEDTAAANTATSDEKNDNNTNGSDDNTNKIIDYVLVDTPGQIEAFAWSASGSILSTSLASSFPTVLVYVVDTPRCAASVHTFMSNMLYACSMLYRARLPMIVVLNKVDVVGCEFVKEWMEDYQSFQEALDDSSSGDNDATSGGGGGSGGGGYYASLTRSLSLVLDEFYNHLHKVGVSSITGEGVAEFWKVVRLAAKEYESGYLVDLRLRAEERRAKEMAMMRANERRFLLDKKKTTEEEH